MSEETLMSEQKIKVFVVDDDALSRMIIIDEISCDEFDILEFEDGQQCIDALDKSPDIILMDVEMPRVDGYQTCRHIKANFSTENTEVIFISSHDTIDEKLAGYDAGGSDYIIKPIQTEEVKQKLSVAIKSIALRKNKTTEVQSAMQTAMMAISNAGEQGIVLDFMRRSFSTNTIQALAELIVDSFRSFGLATTVQIRSSDATINVSSKEPASPLEIELLSKLKDSGRIQERLPRLIANFGDISLLIKNMSDDEEKRGRMRDHLALLLEGAEARLLSLETDLTITSAISSTKQSLNNIKIMQQNQKNIAMNIMDQAMKNLEESFMSCGLTEEQESMLLKIAQEGVDESLDNFEKGLLIDQEFSKIITSLESIKKVK